MPHLVRRSGVGGAGAEGAELAQVEVHGVHGWCMDFLRVADVTGVQAEVRGLGTGGTFLGTRRAEGDLLRARGTRPL